MTTTGVTWSPPAPWRLGSLLASRLLMTIVLLPIIALQAAAGVPFTAGEVIGRIAGFPVLGVLGTWLLLRLLRAVPASAHTSNPEAAGVDVHV